MKQIFDFLVNLMLLIEAFGILIMFIGFAISVVGLLLAIIQKEDEEKDRNCKKRELKYKDIISAEIQKE